ncbi:hypothetical protein ACIPY3_17640 [Paenarthrobacter sp. NPDC089714]|uniref:hypothetical protein n=1 Tax=Paenarthrobacter sp. NPDC089714 TaxID=3364377 RepID=UPI0038093921
MGKVPEEPVARPGQDSTQGSDSDYELIGGSGVIDDRFPHREDVVDDEPSPPRPGPMAVMLDAAWTAWGEARASFGSAWFWLACGLGILASWGLAAGLIAFGESNAWFSTPVAAAVYLVMGAWLAIAAAVLGAVWGFRRAASRFLIALMVGLLRGAAFAVPAGIVLALVGAGSGGPIAMAGAAVVVAAVEVALFGLMGAGLRACFASVAPGAILLGLLLVFFGAGNFVLTVLLLPSTMSVEQASVPVNVERDDAGRITAYECVGQLHSVEVAHTDRVAWIAASNPAMVFGSVAAGSMTQDNELAWVLSGLQWAADGPQRDVPCLGGESSDGLPPTLPVAVTGLALQSAVAASVYVPGRLAQSRRPPSAGV